MPDLRRQAAGLGTSAHHSQYCHREYTALRRTVKDNWPEIQRIQRVAHNLCAACSVGRHRLSLQREELNQLVRWGSEETS